MADELRALFQTDCDVYFVFNGTAANSLALASLYQSYHSVICSPLARVGKLTPAGVTQLVTKRSDIHFPKPKVVSITQATELGTVYGVDVLCFGGTKNGLPVGDAVLYFDRTLSEDFAWRVKQAGQLASKMRCISARRLYERLQDAPGVELLHATEVNSAFARLPRAGAVEVLAYARLDVLPVEAADAGAQARQRDARPLLLQRELVQRLQRMTGVRPAADIRTATLAKFLKKA